MKWFEETLHGEWRQLLEVSEVLHRSKTAHQDLIIFENPTLGRVLALDGAVQTTERDEFIYHEMLAHVPILAHGAARQVLIIGGGDGGMLEEVLKHRTVERATLVEIDGRVVELCREYLPSISAGAFDDTRAELVIADGARFVAETEARYDLVIVDSTDPVGPGEALFGAEFYGGCRRCLAAGGILVTQSGVPFIQGDELRDGSRRLAGHFADVAAYLAPVPTYTGGFMAFGWASDDPAPRQTAPTAIAERFAAAAIATRYYNPEIHAAAFALPNYVRELMG